MKDKAKGIFLNGYSCSESMIQAAYESGIIDEKSANELNKVATAFAGGLGSGCICGAVSGAEMVIGHLLGRTNNSQPNAKAKQVAKEFIEKFKQKRKATCCKVLCQPLDFGDPKRRENCSHIVEDAAEILEALLKNTFVEKN